MTGRNICSSRPVDILGFQLVSPSTDKVCDGDGDSVWPGVQVLAVAVCTSSGQPNGVPTTDSNCTCAICNCDGRRMGSIPASTKGASATGPTMVMRYSRF